MKSAYDTHQVHNLTVLRESRNWLEHHFIRKEQFEQIQQTFKCRLYHPNFLIRIILFVATALGLVGVAGLAILMVKDVGSDALRVLAVIYGIVSFIALDIWLIKKDHYKSGVTEAVMFQACICILGAVIDESELTFRVLAFLVFAYTAFRYLDWISTLLSVGFLGAVLFSLLMKWENTGQAIMPFFFMMAFSTCYLSLPKIKARPSSSPWHNNLWLLEVSSLIIVYLSGNYYMVRELSIEISGLPLSPEEHIPFAYFFYAFTAVVPIIYVVTGLRKHNSTLIRVGALCAILSILTFKYYFSIAPPEITLTVAGALVILLAASLLNYLRLMGHGITRENILSEKWASASAEGFLVSQTMGGNEAKPNNQFEGGGGTFGGGGATGDV
ncbi:MAG TPA: hypothetical protein PLX35_00080 [Cyclobacteriaceae bacterium]|nr:hypothetical protein [Cyclobacteriaceae bacterium]